MPANTATPGVPGATLNGVALPATKKLVMVNGSLSASLALANKPALAPTVKVISSVSVLLSLASTGASGVGIGLAMDTVAGKEAKPKLSITTKVTGVTIPL